MGAPARPLILPLPRNRFMSHLSLRLCVPLLLLGAIRSISAHEFTPPERPADQTYRDVPFAQEIATIFRSEVSLAEHPPRTVRVDRDGRVLITTDRLLLKGREESFRSATTPDWPIAHI